MVSMFTFSHIQDFSYSSFPSTSLYWQSHGVFR